MAVFPDRIVLKNSTDAQGTIEAAIATGGTDEITQGELVIGLESGVAKFYTKDADGNIVNLGSATTNVSELGDLIDVDLTPPATNTQGIIYNSTSGYWEAGDLYQDPLVAAGDIVYHNGSGPQRLGIGNVGRVLAAAPGAPQWVVAPILTFVQSNAPTLRSDGTSLLNGDQWYNLDNGTLYVRSNGVWVAVTSDTSVETIDDLSDVDTSTNAPSVNQILVWDGSNWVPADQTGGTGGGGGGSIAGTVLQKEETQTASSGAATFTELGESGLLVSLSTTADAWVALYPTAADRTADASRAYGVDPAPGVGVLAEFYVTTAGEVLASPGTTYFNNDTVSTSALYAAVRDQAGANVAADITIKAYVHQGFGGVGTARATDSGTAVSGLLTLAGMGQTGQFCTVTSSLDAWVVFYGSDADRTADNARAFTADPTPGSGVQAEFYIAAGTTILATPGSTYFNNDTDPTDAMYLAVRDAGGSAVNSLITVTVYAETNYTGISGGTFGSG